jgi:hypothetical protein
MQRVIYYTDMMNGDNMTITSWSGTPYSDTLTPLATLQDAHFKTFNAAESQTSQRARSRYLHGLRVLESAFNYLVNAGELSGGESAFNYPCEREVAANEQH